MDYARFGRQIALPELGVAGQTALGAARLRADAAVAPLAHALWTAAGGSDLAPETLASEAPRSGPAALGVAAWHCVESARAALGLGPAELDPALRARLGG